MTLHEVQSRVSSDEFALWIADYSIEPWGEIRSDLQMGILATVMASCFAAKGTTYTPADFMPEFKEKVDQSIEDMKEAAKQFCLLMGGTVR